MKGLLFMVDLWDEEEMGYRFISKHKKFKITTLDFPEIGDMITILKRDNAFSIS